MSNKQSSPQQGSRRAQLQQANQGRTSADQSNSTKRCPGCPGRRITR